MRYIVSEPEFKLYQEGFAGKDTLDREEKGKQLSKLVENIDDPLVIALDGPWGSGKSFFLKCWVGAHTLENEGAAQTVYFDAFANDYLDDPLLALTRVIREKFETSDEDQGKLKKAKELGKALWKPAARIALAVGTSGLSEVTGAVGDAVISSTGKEAEQAIENLWKKETGRRQAMEEFRAALVALTQPEGPDVLRRKLVIAIDELDRCRPDYALSVLEVIKHFFNVPNVHFVLGVNIKELGNSVRARYGHHVDANNYLQKFVSLTLQLPERSKKYEPLAARKYFDIKSKEMKIENDISEDLRLYFDNENFLRKISLRNVQKILSYALIYSVVKGEGKPALGYRVIIAGAIIMRCIDFDKYKEMLAGNIDIHGVIDILDLGKSGNDWYNENIIEIWKYAIYANDDSKVKDTFGRMFGHGRKVSLPQIVADNLEVIQLYE